MVKNDSLSSANWWQGKEEMEKNLVIKCDLRDSTTNCNISTLSGSYLN